jgi:ring-1,2-phenylacetyl-CoA epoxidase subunit PaaE
MSKYYHLRIKEVVKESEDAVSIHFWHPWNEVIQYKPGQYLTVLWPTEAGEKIRRSYSLSSSPYTDASPAITVKRVAGGLVSDHLVSKAKMEDVLEVLQAMGTFCLVPEPDQKRCIFLLGTGSGITPLLSIAKSVLIAEHESKVVLIYGNRREEDIICRGIIEQLARKYQGRFEVIHSLTQPSKDWTGQSGRLTTQKLIDLLSPWREEVLHADTRFYVCGQEDFMDGAKQALIQLGAQKDAIHRESFFSIKESEFEAPPAPSLPATGSQEREIKLRYEGQEYMLKIPPQQSVLEAALANDVDLPYSCQAGMCTACLGRVIQGEVTLDEYDGLTEAEIKEGFILTCVAHPRTDDVIIEVE